MQMQEARKLLVIMFSQGAKMPVCLQSSIVTSPGCTLLSLWERLSCCLESNVGLAWLIAHDGFVPISESAWKASRG